MPKTFGTPCIVVNINFCCLNINLLVFQKSFIIICCDLFRMTFTQYNQNITFDIGVSCSSKLLVAYANSLLPVKTVYYFAESVYLDCIEGFNNIGTKLQHCLQDGSWSPANPKCVGKILF